MIIARSVKAFAKGGAGSIVASLAVVAPLVFGGGLFAVAYGHSVKEKQALRSAADAAALATVRHLRVGPEDSTDGDSVLSSIALAVAQANLGSDAAVTANAFALDANRVQVDLTLALDDPLLSIGNFGVPDISVSAVAETFGSRNICVIALEEGQQVGINLQHEASIRAGNCGVYSNSPAVASIVAQDNAHLDANFICSAGGYDGPSANFSSAVVTDCPAIEDPIASRPLPDTPPFCDFYQTSFVTGADTLQPGHYCGDIIIEGDAEITMESGNYFISEGQFHVKGNAKLTGENVAIFMQSSWGNVQFEENAEVVLSAPTEGDLAGIVIASRPVCGGTDCHSRLLNITSPLVRSLLGTIYIPEDRMIINTNMSISEEAAFTIVVARFMQGQQSPTLVLNTDYGATDVPVPDGFMGTSGARLTR